MRQYLLHFAPLVLFATMAWLSGTPVAADEAPSGRRVVIISIDGLRPDAIGQTETPELDALMAAGVQARRAWTVYPPLTLPSHTSMLTGRKVRAHGITWNGYREEAGPVAVPTCLELAHQTGLHTVMFVGKRKLKHLHRPGSVNEYAQPTYPALGIAGAYKAYVEQAGLPHLSFLHFPDPDGTGHAFGWMSARYLEAVTDSSKAVGIVMEVIAQSGHQEHTVVIVTADHGGHGKHHATSDRRNLGIPWIAAGAEIPAGGTLHRTMYTYDTAATALWLLGLPVPEEWEGTPPTELVNAMAKR